MFWKREGAEEEGGEGGALARQAGGTMSWQYSRMGVKEEGGCMLGVSIHMVTSGQQA